VSIYAVIPDIQYPDHDLKAVHAGLDYIASGTWDGVLIVGDELDSPEPSQWSKGLAGEYAGTLQRSIDGCHDLLADIVDAAGAAPVHLMRSNHQQRIQNYVARYAPALSSLRSLDYATLLGLDELGITFHREPWMFTKEGGGWYLIHGDEGNLIRTAGGTSLGIARRLGASCIGGHTHRLGIQHEHSSMGGKITRHLWGVEAGHWMNMKKASYLRAGSGNWSQGMAVIQDGYPIVLPIARGKVVTP